MKDMSLCHSLFKNCIAPSKRTRITVTLSEDFLSREALRTFSAAFWINVWISVAERPTPSLNSRFKVAQMILATSLFVRTSQIPSDAITSMLCLGFSIENCFISGVATTTPGLPPYVGILHSMSPKVRLIASLPGRTRLGPSSYVGTPQESTPFSNLALYIFPPLASILFVSSFSSGLWSFVNLNPFSPSPIEIIALESPTFAT